MIYAPLVMPDVITGLSLLLLFVAAGFARGFWTIALAHITFSLCYVAVVVQSRLVTFDRSLEEAAADLGCPPLKTFLVITLPMKIYSQVRLGVTPEINAVCTILIALVATGVLIASIVTRRREIERQRAERLAAATP
jgi:putrescine transport system permease protein